MIYNIILKTKNYLLYLLFIVQCRGFGTDTTRLNPLKATDA